MNAAWAAALFAVDPVGTGGVRLRGPAGPAREAWLAHLRELLPATTPLKNAAACQR
jgi:magnesium chelatase subunit D